jgi:hypothetical protein
LLEFREVDVFDEGSNVVRGFDVSRKKRLSRRIDGAGFLDNCIPNQGLESASGHQIDLAPEQFGEIEHQPSMFQETNFRLGLELHQEVEIAVRTHLTASRGAEDSQLPDGVPAAKLRELGVIYYGVSDPNHSFVMP